MCKSIIMPWRGLHRWQEIRPGYTEPRRAIVESSRIQTHHHHRMRRRSRSQSVTTRAWESRKKASVRARLKLAALLQGLIPVEEWGLQSPKGTIREANKWAIPRLPPLGKVPMVMAPPFLSLPLLPCYECFGGTWILQRLFLSCKWRSYKIVISLISCYNLMISWPMPTSLSVSYCEIGSFSLSDINRRPTKYLFLLKCWEWW